MNVCFIYKEDYPWDVRVEKIINTLSSKGHDVVLGCKNIKDLPRNDQLGNIKIRRMPNLGPKLSLLTEVVNAPFFFNPFWFWLIWKSAAVNNAEVIIVRDLPLMPVAILVAKLTGRYVVFDMAECYPEMYASNSNPSLKARILKNPKFASFLEGFSVRYSNLVFVMIEESRDRLLSFGVPAKKIKIVSNTPELPKQLPNLLERQKQVVRLLYVGFVTEIRGIDKAVYGIHELLKRDPDVKIEFDIIGVGSALSNIKKLVKDLGLQDRVRCHGWCEQKFVDELYNQCNVGVLTYDNCPHWNHTIPNKLFDYMLAGYPVLTTTVKPIARIVEKYQCGLACSDTSPRGIADALIRLLDMELRIDMGRKGQQAILDQFHWQQDTEIMLKALSDL